MTRAKLAQTQLPWSTIFLNQNPDFESLAMADIEPLPLSSNESFDSSDMGAILRIKRILNLRSMLLGAALFCSLMPFSMVGSSSQGIYWIMFRDLPLLASFFCHRRTSLLGRLCLELSLPARFVNTPRSTGTRYFIAIWTVAICIVGQLKLCCVDAFWLFFRCPVCSCRLSEP